MKLMQYLLLIALGTCAAHAMEQEEQQGQTTSTPIAITAASNHHRFLTTPMPSSQSAKTSPIMKFATVPIPHASSAPALAAIAKKVQDADERNNQSSSSDDDDDNDDSNSDNSDDVRPNTNRVSPTHGSPSLSRKNRNDDNDLCEEFAELARSHEGDSSATSFYLQKKYAAQRHRNKSKKKK